MSQPSTLFSPRLPTSAQPDRDLEERLWRLNRLPRRVQRVLLLGRLDGLDFVTIGQRLGLAPRQVAQDMAHALAACRTREGRNNDLIRRQAIDWYVRLQQTDVTPSERIDFRRWLDASPAHLEAFHGTELCWRQLPAQINLLAEGHWYRQPRRPLSRAWVMTAAVLAASFIGLYPWV